MSNVVLAQFVDIDSNIIGAQLIDLDNLEHTFTYDGSNNLLTDNVILNAYKYTQTFSYDDSNNLIEASQWIGIALPIVYYWSWNTSGNNAAVWDSSSATNLITAGVPA